jgi:integrase
MPRNRKTRLYTRQRGGVKRFYADFRDYADVGGGRETLIAPGEKRATSDPSVAQVLAARRLEELDAKRRGRAVHGINKEAGLAEFASLHLIAKAKSGTVTDDWLECIEIFLQRAVDFLGADRDLASITVEDVRQYTNYLQVTNFAKQTKEESDKPRRVKTLTPGTVRHHLSALSNLYRRAASEGYVLPGFNPVASLLEKPVAKREEARWLEVHEAALLLEAARLHEVRPDLHNTHSPFAYPLIATFLLTGGRKSEILGLELEDVSFDRKTVTFRPNRWRRLKTGTSHRSVPIWPQLEEILREYVFGADGPPGQLLFPSFKTGREAMVVDFRKLLDAVAARSGWKLPGAIRSKMFRHTYTAARLQNLDGGAPVSEYTVARELGHGGHTMIHRVYGHLGQVRHRSEHVEYRVEQFEEKLGDRLIAVRSPTTMVR